MGSIQRIDLDLPSDVLGLAIVGQNLGGAARFGELLGGGDGARPTLLAFLRHFG